VTYAATDLDGTELYEFSDSSSPTPVYLERNSHDDVTWTHDESGTPTSHAAYDPFGNLVSGSTTLSATRWQSSYQDASSGLYYVIARWYAPTMGRFLSDDPLTADATDPQARNPYPYAAGDPIDGSDPSGQCIWGPDVNIGCNPSPSPPTPPTPPTPPPCTSTSCILNTSVVGQFYEPDGWKDICGPGSLRVVLAFTATSTAKSPDKPLYGSTAREYRKGANGKWIVNSKGKRKKFHKAVPWPTGADPYMGYLVEKELVYDPASDTVSSPADRAKDVLNSESGGGHYFKEAQAGGHETTFDAAIETAVRKYGVPTMVGTREQSIPSQVNATKDFSHWITVVGYDKDSYYYIDTCRGGNGCGRPYEYKDPVTHERKPADPPYAGKDVDGNSYSYRANPLYQDTWKISKHGLYKATDFTNEYYIFDSGLHALSVTGR
jgi:RHS repeat-associated protein